MPFRVVIAVLLMFCFGYRVSGQLKGDLVQSRILILLDESSSMIEPWAGSTKKYLAAHEIILRIMDSVYSYNNEVEFSLRVFGHQHTVQEKNCYDTRNEVSFTKSNRTQMDLRLSDIHPLGVTPIAYALKQAAENDLPDEVHNAYSIILITDGGESCGGDICEVMRSLIAAKVFFKPYIVGLEDAPELRNSYACMGNFLSVTKEAEIGDAVSKIVSTFKPIIKVTRSEFREIKELGANAPSILKVNTPPIKKAEKPEEIIKKAPEVKPTKPAVAKIDHLSCDPVLKLYLSVPNNLTLNKVSIPPPPPDGITLPHVDNIDRLATAPLAELAGTSLKTTQVKTFEPPAMEEEKIPLPPVSNIEHQVPAPLIELAGASLHFEKLKKAELPAPVDIKTDLPQVTAIERIATAPLSENVTNEIPSAIPTRAVPPAPEEKIELPIVNKLERLHLAPLSEIVTKDIPKTITVRIVPPAPEEKIESPATSKIGHLTAALPAAKAMNDLPKKIPLRIVPAAPEEKVEMPPLHKFEHLLAAPVTEFVLNVPRTHLNKFAPPGSNITPETPDLPRVTNISHLLPALKNEPDLTPAVDKRLSLIRKIPTIAFYDVPSIPQVPAISHLKPAGTKKFEILTASTEPLKLVTSLPPTVEERETPELPGVPKIARLNPARLKQASIQSIPILPIKQAGNNIPEVEYKEKPEKPQTGKITKIKPAHVIEPKVIFIIEDHPLKQHTAPQPPTFTPQASAGLAASNPTFGPPKPKSDQGIKSTYTVETVDAKETSVMIYLTNGHGKYFLTTPQVLIVEPFSNKIVKKFYRTVDPAGLPDVQTGMPPGTFNIAIGDIRNLNLYDVEIAANKLSKIIVKLKNCSLAFEYEDAPKRPITEFIATVVERNVANGKVIEQKCTQKLEYEPGNYHIFFNTYPKTDRNVDLDFDATKVLYIPQPGFVKFTTDMKNRKLNLYKVDNDKFLKFDTKNSSDTTLKHLQIQPGQYQVHYMKDPTKPYSKETVIPFAIKSNEVTEVALPGN